MSDVTTGGRLWVEHHHRHHHTPTDPWVFGPLGPTLQRSTDPVIAPDPVGTAHFLFWSAAGASDGPGAYPVGQSDLTADPPSFPDGDAPGSLTAWYIDRVGNGGRSGLIFDAFSEARGDWIDWDETNNPFTVTPTGARGASVDVDDDEAYTDIGNTPVMVAAADRVSTEPLLVFDRWLVIGDGTAIAADATQVTQSPHTSGVAFALYRAVEPSPPPGPDRFIPEAWRMGDPALFREYLRRQSELTRIATLIDVSSSLGDDQARAAIQSAMLDSLVQVAQNRLNALTSPSQGK